jgi:polyphosphate kinase
MADAGILLLRYWLEVGPGEQTRYLESRMNDPRKIWRLSDPCWNREPWVAWLHL